MVSYYKKYKVGIVEFDDPDSKANLLSMKNLRRLDNIIDRTIMPDNNIHMLFFISRKEKIFIAGADIRELYAIFSKKQAQEFCKTGQHIFNKIEQLPIHTFAVINGACVGGGLELALACDHIIAVRNKYVRLGFPEVKLFISPGFGGSRRLAERIGKRQAHNLIKSGKIVCLKEAEKIGLIDGTISEAQLYSYKKLITFCERFSNKEKKCYMNNNLDARALDRRERRVFSEKVVRRPAKNALSAFLLTRRYKNYPWISGKDKSFSIASAAVVGAGTMGRGIAYLLSAEGNLPVQLDDIDRETLGNARKFIKDVYKDAVKRGLLYPREASSRFSNISFNQTNFKKVDLLVESVSEDMEIKRNLFIAIEEKVYKRTILATNTSCLSVHEIACSLRYPDRFVGMHFFNPAYKMKLVEVVSAGFTSKLCLKTVIEFLQKLKRVPIVVKDSPGFLVNRLFLPYINQAVFMIEEGFSEEDIEKAMLDFGMPVGPLTLLRQIGLEVVYRASKILEHKLGSRMKVPQTLQYFPVMAGHIKPRSGNTGRKSSYIVKRLLWPIKREAELCLEENVVPSREIIDLALLLGIGFPRDKRIWESKVLE